jgi:hypothetical protein
MDATTEKAHRYRCRAFAALPATEAKASCEIVTHSNRATARLAREMGLMKGAAARAATKTGLFCQVLVDQDQLLEKLDIGKDGVAHCGQSEVVRNRRLPQKECLFKFLAGVTPPSSALRDQIDAQTHQVG